MRKQYFIGIDNGGTVTKAALFDENGKQISSASRHTDLIVEQSGFTERNTDELLSANFDVIRHCVQASGINPGNVAGIGITGHGKGLYLLDKKGLPLGNGIVSTDNRAAEYAKKWSADATAEQAEKLTFQKVLSCQPVALLKWLKDHDRARYNEIGSILSVTDIIRYGLTGKIGAEITNMSGTNLMNLRTKTYDTELTKLFGISEINGALPPICASEKFFGELTPKAAAECGLKAGTPVAGGMFDIDACALGMGIIDSGSLCVIGGTWSINQYISEKPVSGVAMNSLYCVPGYYLAEECSPTSASNLEWFIKRFMSGTVKECGGTTAEFYEKLNAMAAKSELTSCHQIFLPFLFASNEGSINAGLYNMTAADTIEDSVRAVYEGIVFSHKSHVDKLLRSRAVPPVGIRLAGGIANSAFWSQMFADVMGTEVLTAKEREIGCAGAAIAAAIAAGKYVNYSEAVEKTFEVTSVYKPNEENNSIYKQKYGEYRNLIERLSGNTG